jgi:uncharacterized repeat protein (TIGR03803 family)
VKGAKQIKLSALSPYALFLVCVTVAACSQGTELSRFQYSPPLNVLSDRIGRRLSYHVLYSFGALPDGKNPAGGLIDVDGTLYGTTAWGGVDGEGTVFSITSGGTEKVLHSFGTGSDGYNPNAGLIDVGGTLYGTTEYGGSDSCSSTFYHGCGTVFSITTGGKEKVLHSFSHAKAEGSNPLAGLIYVGGMLYGATKNGGSYNVGTIFSMTLAGTEKLLHSFGHGTDGRYPDATLIDADGGLYGTTFNGGAHGEGTVFSITTGGTEKVLHSFGKGSDGSEAGAGLIEVGRTLYGTTFQGGYGGGTVFSIMTGGAEKVLYNFGKGTDGFYPLAGLIEAKGTLYGTTFEGGAYRACGGYYDGCGTVFSITTSGAEKVLHSFGNGSDGTYPAAEVIEVNKTLYGTTYNGGSHNAGTVFTLTP